MSAPSNKRSRVTVGQWLAVLVLGLFIVPLAASNLWGYLQSRRYLTQAAFTNIRNVAALEAAETREFVRAAEDLVPSIIAGNQHLFDVLHGERSGQVDARRTEQSLHEHLTAKVGESATAELFQIISPEGLFLGSSAPGSVYGTDARQSLCFTRGRERTQIVGFDYDVRSPVVADGDDHAQEAAHVHDGAGSDADSDGEESQHHVEDDDEPRMLVAAPITGRDGALLGVFCARFRFDVHRSLLLAYKQRTSHATLYLLDDADRIVCGSFEESHGAPYGERFEALGHDLLARKSRWEGRHHLATGEEVLVAYAPIEDLGWGVVVEVPVARALSDLETLKRQALAVSAAVVALIFLAMFLSWRTVVRPLRALFRTAERIASGAIGETVTPAGPREVVELTTAFNKMSLALAESRQTLEDRIAARTTELHESHKFSEQLLDSIDQRVIVMNRDYRVVKANTAATKMHGPALVGEKCYSALEGRTEPCDECPVRETLDSGMPATTERFQRTLEGREAMRVETYPVVADDGHVESVIAIARRITEEKQLQARMAYQEKVAAFGQLAAGVAHEIGNPLAAIDSQLQLAQNNPERATQTLDVVRHEVGRMSRLLRELVDFSRRKRHGAKLASVNQAVEDVIRLLRHDPRARGVDVGHELEPQLPGVPGTEDHLVQVLLNLGINALDALPGSGELSFHTALEGDHVVVRVADTGPGISEEAHTRLFEPFFTTKEIGEGTGLGLFVSRGIIEDMGGSLELESSSESGTVFVVRVPVAHRRAREDANE